MYIYHKPIVQTYMCMYMYMYMYNTHCIYLHVLFPKHSELPASAGKHIVSRLLGKH